MPAVRMQRAKRNYECKGCDEPIRKGSLYVRIVVPPWEQDFGPEVLRRDRHWITNKFHDPQCGIRYEYTQEAM